MDDGSLMGGLSYGVIFTPLMVRPSIGGPIKYVMCSSILYFSIIFRVTRIKNNNQCERELYYVRLFIGNDVL